MVECVWLPYTPADELPFELIIILGFLWRYTSADSAQEPEDGGPDFLLR